VTSAPTTVFLTGGTGAWGKATLRALRARGDRFHVIALARPGRRNEAILRRFAGPGFEIAWGDLTDAALIAACVARADVVLHLGALVSPAADSQPERTNAVNVGSIRNIVAAVRALPDPSRVGVVGVGSIAESGDRRPPVHWGRIGDPVRVSPGDVYGQSKVAAERELVESGLPRWAWLRQTGIVHPAMIRIRDPIMTHPTLDGVLEWASDDDSARLLANIAEGAPDEFWGDVWHVGGGQAWRLTNWEFLQATAGALGIGDIRRWFDRNWFATRNFHGFWFSDSDRLEALVHFREDTVAAAFRRAGAGLPPGVRQAAQAVSPIVKRTVIRPLIERPRGTLGAIRRGDEREIETFFGSLEAWRAIGDWSTFVPPEPSRVPSRLDHGYDESRAPDTWDAALLAGAADFRGGRLVSPDAPRGAVRTPLEWACAEGHRFTASPWLVLRAGHWCPECVRDTANIEHQAERNRFLAQVVR